MSQSRAWTRGELMVLMNLYHKLTFGQFDSRQPAVVAVAGKLSRTPGSVAMKLSNLASIDPAMKLRGIVGLRGASRLDKSVWKEFHDHLDESVPESEEAFRKLFEAMDGDEVTVVPKEGVCVVKKAPQGTTEIFSNVKVRRGQDYFRNAVLNNFQGKCGVTGINIRELLIASHILPWSSYPEERLNVQNGLCLSRLHDAAFDQGLITFDDNLRLILSSKIRDLLDNKSIGDYFGTHQGTPLNLPSDASLPNPRFLRHHRKKIFKS